MVLAEDLRQAVLQAALQGKLTEQLDTDSNVDEMLEKVVVNIKSNKQNGKADKIEPIDKDNVPYEIPSSWKWIRLGEVANVIRGLTFSTSSKTKKQDMVLVIRGGNIDSKTEKLVYDDNIYVSKDIPKDNQFLRKGDCLIVASSGTKSSIGKSCYIETIDNEVSFGGFMMVVRPHQMINSQLISYHIKQYRQKIINDTVGYISNITNPILNNLLIPLPPAEEQQRIVDKINEIMTKIDEYEKIEKELEILKKEFPTNMKDALLQAAMQGKLTEQLESDSSVDELLISIQKEKEELIAQKKIKKEKSLSNIDEEEIPFDIPENWRWVRWGNLAYSIQYGYNAPAQEAGKIKMVRISDIQDNSVNWDSVPYCDIEDEEIETYRLQDNDILFARTGGTVGKSFLVNGISENAIYAGYLIRTRYSDQLVPKYLKLFMESQLYWVQLQNGKTQGCQPNCNGQTLSKMIIPLPPIEEQQRIVERLDTLLPLCEDLKEE